MTVTNAGPGGETAQEALVKEQARLHAAEQAAKQSRWRTALYRRRRRDLFTDGFASAFDHDHEDDDGSPDR